MKQRAFLAAFALCGQVVKSAKLAHIDLQSHYNWLRTSPEYVKAFEEAIEKAGDMLEDVATRRAIEGVPKPVYYQGQECGIVIEYSDNLLKFLLKGAKPFKYMDRVDLTTRGRSLNIIIDGSDDGEQQDTWSALATGPQQLCLPGFEPSVDYIDGELVGVGNAADEE